MPRLSVVGVASVRIMPERLPWAADAKDLWCGNSFLFEQLPNGQGIGFAQEAMQGAEMPHLRRGTGGDAPEQLAQLVAERRVQKVFELERQARPNSISADESDIHAEKALAGVDADEVTCH